MRYFISIIIFAGLIFSCNKKTEDQPAEILIDSVTINSIPVVLNGIIDNVKYEQALIKLSFRSAVDTNRFNREHIFFTGGIDTSYRHRFSTDRQVLSIQLANLNPLTQYRMIVDAGPNLGSSIKDGFSVIFVTQIDSTPKFPLVPDDSLLTIVQRQTFRYFWDYAHPVSGLARERLGSGDVVTSGGSGFGLMAILAGIERNFISRTDGFNRIRKIVDFLNLPSTDKFHGAFPHWLNGSTGKVIPFSQKDNGGDIVETSYLMQGLLTVREYFRKGSSREAALCDTITKLWEKVEWNWYRNNQQKLFWHWSPTYNWEMNMPVTGWNEALIVYILAASSPTNPISKQVYDEGWARNGSIRNGKSFYDIRLPLGENLGGPLFFAHYSFLGLDPRHLADQYANYLEQNVSHSLINNRYCAQNPRKWRGYSNVCWGLTASDTQSGYSASSPSNDIGVIAPTAAVSSIPYTPAESLGALKFFYYILGDRIWGEYGFHDAFNLTALWFANSYLAIDEGPIVCMIENYRTGLLWSLFMSSADIRNGLTRLGFTY
jgi:hypothetical protein